jgi:hypothetical protein
VAGVVGRAALGSVVLVSFVDGNPARPVITSFDDPESPGFGSLLVRLGDADANDEIVCKSDLQAAIDSIEDKYNAHTHVETGGTTGAPLVHQMAITATGSPVVKAGA